MIVRYKESNHIRDIVWSFTESRFSADEVVKQVAQRLHDNQTISSLVFENIQLYEKGANALRHAILGHKSLRILSLLNPQLNSYPITTDDEYFFPQDLDAVVAHLCAVLRDGRLNQIEIINMDFHDRTTRHFEHFDMVEPATMRDLLTEEKEPFYVKEILFALSHNPHLQNLKLTLADMDVASHVKLIEENIKKHQFIKKLGAMMNGAHDSTHTHLIPDMFKFAALWAWMSKFKKR